MKKFMLVAAVLFISLRVLAGNGHIVRVEQGTTTTAGGIGAYSDIAYAFAAGDKVTVNATASKRLEKVLMLLYPNKEIGKVSGTRNVTYTFTVPEEGIVVIRFISDRDGTNRISYTISRQPASDATQQYDTKVVWDKPAKANNMPAVPRRAKG